MTTGTENRAQPELSGASRGAITVAWVLRSVVLLTAIFHALGGEVLYLLICLVAIALLLTPAILARTSRANMPIELEILVLWWLVGDMTLGRAARLYEFSLWYDKVLHFGNSILVGLLAFLLVYILHMVCCLSGPAWIKGAMILLLTLGVGAGWEIVEYLADLAFARGAQGSPLMNPLDDTMWDLMLDGAGGVVGALLGPLYMRTKRSSTRIQAFRARTGMQCGHDIATESCRYCAA